MDFPGIFNEIKCIRKFIKQKHFHTWFIEESIFQCLLSSVNNVTKIVLFILVLIYEHTYNMPFFNICILIDHLIGL